MQPFIFILLSASSLLLPAASKPLDIPGGLAPRADAPPETPKKPTIPTKQGSTPPDAPSKQGQLAPLAIDRYALEWMQSDTNKDKIAYSASTTNGGWESWAQFELEFFIKQKLVVPVTTKVREVRAYADKSLAADFVFDPPPTSKNVGVILELKCENQNMQGMKAKVQSDIAKLSKPLDAKYQKYEKMVLAMAYSPKVQKDLRDLGMVPLGGGVQLMGGESGNTLQIFHKTVSGKA